MREAINFDIYAERTQEELLEYLDKMARIIAIELGLNFSYETYKKLYYYLCRDFVGFNRVEPLLRDYFVEDIECNGANSPVFIVHRAYRNLKTSLIFEDMDELSSFVEKLAQRSGKYISYAEQYWIQVYQMVPELMLHILKILQVRVPRSQFVNYKISLDTPTTT
jgi:Flp pilus assembly CpaF family ATPase